jgi:hypothetical protein
VPPWKPIVAALVIFVAGVVSGAMGCSFTGPVAGPALARPADLRRPGSANAWISCAGWVTASV